jgi:hypothetical protein
MTNELNLLNELHIGDTVGSTNRIVIAATKKADRIPGDSYAYWITICHRENELHPYVVWSVVARPNGFEASNGDYCTTLEKAVTIYKKRGGEA